MDGNLVGAKAKDAVENALHKEVWFK